LAPQVKDHGQHGTSATTQVSKISDLAGNYETTYPTATPQQILSYIIAAHPELSQQQSTMQSHYQPSMQAQYYSPMSFQNRLPMSSQYQSPMPFQYQSSMQPTQQNQSYYINPAICRGQTYADYYYN